MLARILAIALVVLLIASNARARTWYVMPDGSGDAPTVQAGIDSSASGDTILVAPGTYYEHIRVLDKSIVLRSESGPEVTTLTGEGVPTEAPVVSLRLGEAFTAVLEGFTISGGSVTACGGGVSARGGRPVIRNNVIRNNHAVFYGAGICVSNALPVIESNRIEENDAGYEGGGMYIVSSDNVQLTDNVITNNRATQRGGGLAINSFSDATISRNHIESNFAQSGGGLFSSGDVVLEDSWVFSNHAEGNGGGMYVSNAFSTIRRTVIARNSADVSGGGIYLNWSSTIEKCTLAANRAPRGSAVSQGTRLVQADRVIVSHNEGGPSITCDDSFLFSCSAFYGEDPATPGSSLFDGPCGNIIGADGNFLADPRLCAVQLNDFTLRADSPCLPGQHPHGEACDLIGALGLSCAATPVARISWGTVKAHFTDEAPK